MKKAYKCSDLYTATFEDGALMTGTLDFTQWAALWYVGGMISGALVILVYLNN